MLIKQGYLIPAIGDIYIKCANKLADSIKQWHPDANITILTEDMLPYGKFPGFANDWQCYDASPYEHIRMCLSVQLPHRL